MTDPALLAHGAGTASAAAWPLLVVVLAAAAGACVVAAGRLRAAGRRWPAARTVSLLTGLALLAVALSPPVEAATSDVRGHMTQHLLLGMAAPIALVLGAPLTLLLAVLPVPGRRAVAGVLRSRALHTVSHVATAAVLTVGGLGLLYLTPLYALSTRSAAVHTLVHVHLLLAGCLFAWAVAGPDPAPRRPSTAVRVGALVLAGGAHSALAKLLYSRAPDLPPGGGHGVVEVQQAAQWMYYGGHLSDLVLLVALFGTGHRLTAARARRSARWSASVPATARGSGGSDG